MNKNKILSLVLAAFLLTALFVGCRKEDEATTGTTKEGETVQEREEGPKTTEKHVLKGEITYIHNRTDIDDNLMQDYIAQFNEKYPEIKVSTETASDYEGMIRVRLNSDDYGDALILPDELNLTDYPDFFTVLGKASEMEKKYNWIRTKKCIGEDVFGIAAFGNANGIIYNKRVFKEAGIDELPSSPEEFIGTLKKIRDNTKVIPLYTNYFADWPLAGQWEGHRTSVAGDTGYVISMPHIDDPFSPGRPHYIVYKVMYDAVANGLVEEDPMTSDWESSKVRLGNGEIAAMVLGSWAIQQCKDLSDTPEDVGYMPFPYTNEDGKIYANSGGDKALGINKNSKNKEAARAWIDWFLDESTFARDSGAIPTLKGAAFPDTLKAFQDLGVILITDDPAPQGEEGLVDELDKLSEVGLWESNFKKDIIEAALGNKDLTYDEIMDELNEKWAGARKEKGLK